MVLINHELKAIYIHIPKTGGSYIKYLLKKYYGFETINQSLFSEKHSQFVHTKIDDKDPKYLSVTNITIGGLLRYYMTSNLFNDMNNMDETKWKTYKKFAIIRCPYDRIVSAFCYCTDTVRPKLTLEEKPERFLNFKEYLLRYKQRESCIGPFDNYCYMHSIIPQCDHLIDINNEMNIDYIGRFENLNEDLCDILIKLGVKEILHSEEIKTNYKKNKATFRGNYVKYYDETTIELVNQICEIDFANFNQYIKHNNMNELKRNKNHYVDDKTLMYKNTVLLKKLNDNPDINVVTTDST